LKDLYEEYLNWIATKLNTTIEFEEEFLNIAEYTDAEYYDFMQQIGEHDLIIITKKCWERCKEGAKYEY